MCRCDGVDVMLPVSVCLASAMEDHTTSINITVRLLPLILCPSYPHLPCLP